MCSGQTHYKMISCNIWLPVVIHRSKTRNNVLDVFWGIETIIMPLSRQPQKKSFCPVSHSLAPTFMKIFFIMRLPWVCALFLFVCGEGEQVRSVPVLQLKIGDRPCLNLVLGLKKGTDLHLTPITAFAKKICESKKSQKKMCLFFIERSL